MASVLVINGPNLNLLGLREPALYGHDTLASIEAHLKEVAAQLNLEIACFQSNHEGAIVDAIQAARTTTDFILINAGAYTHTSVAIRDALLGVEIPFIEIHLSNVYAREDFRHHSYLSDKAKGVIAGFGADGYEFALRKAAKLIAAGK